jgi:hypothetical protein
MPLTHYALDHFVAPKLSSLTSCGMPEIAFPVVPFAAVVLNQIFVRPVGQTQIRLLTNTLRWIDGAFASYVAARTSLIAYTTRSRGSLSDYYRAVLHIEQCIAATHHSERLVSTAYRLLGSIDRPRSDAAERLRSLYNTSKHVDERIEEGRLLDDAALPIWLTNENIESKDRHLSFVELSAFMEDYVGLINSLSNQHRPDGPPA